MIRTLIILPLISCVSYLGPMNAEEPPQSSLSGVIAADFEDAERIASSSIKVQEKAGLVTLFGTADSLMDKRMAERIAKRTRGVKAVANQIVVRQSPQDDAVIRDDVMTVLRANGAVERPQIKVDVSGGEVSLFGKVDSLAEKRISEMAVSGVKGVTEVNNQLVVVLHTNRPDRSLQEEINTLFVHSVYLDDVDLDVKVRDGIASLSGVVRVADQKDAAEAIAGIPGVSEVNSEQVSIDETAGDSSVRARRYAEVSDQSITEVLHRSFRADPLVFDVADSIKVAVDSGTITLSGHVNRLLEKSKAESLAMGVVGVNRVVNELTVQLPENSPSDDEIVLETQAALARSPHLDRRNFRVHCQRAHVSLYGIVGSNLEKQIAGWLADSVTGVVHVNNSLAVEKPWVEKSDEQIESDLKRKLKFALFDVGNEVEVNVEDGVAILRGEVDTWRQWQAALDLALEAGATHPHNLINVRYHPPHTGMRTYVPR